MNLFLKNNSRTINYEIDQLKPPPDEHLAPNSLSRDYTDDDSDDENMVTESDEEGIRNNSLTNQMRKTFYRVDCVNLYSNPNNPAI